MASSQSGMRSTPVDRRGAGRRGDFPLSLLYLLLCLVSLAGFTFTLSKASAVATAVVKYCADGLVCISPDYLNAAALPVALGWATILLIPALAYPGVRKQKLLTALLSLAAISVLMFGNFVLIAVLRIKAGMSPLFGLFVTLAIAGLLIWVFRSHLRPAIKATLPTFALLLLLGAAYFWGMTPSTVELDIDVSLPDHLGGLAALLATLVPPAAIGQFLLTPTQRADAVAPHYLGAALGWSLLAVLMISMLHVWNWLGHLNG